MPKLSCKTQVQRRLLAQCEQVAVTAGNLRIITCAITSLTLALFKLHHARILALCNLKNTVLYTLILCTDFSYVQVEPELHKFYSHLCSTLIRLSSNAEQT